MTERIIKLDMKKPLDTAEAVSVAAWTAFRTDEISYIDDKHGHIAAITHPDKTDRILTLNQAGVLADLIRGVQAGAKLRYYPRGADDADHPMVQSLRAFTHDGGGFISEHDDVRDAYVWTSGFTEHWFKVEDLITALDNIQGTHGLDKPMAVIDYDKEQS